MIVNKIKKNRLLRFLAVKVINVISIINRFVPKNEKKILFYESGSSCLQDNSEAFYVWLKNNGGENKYDIVVCSPNEENYNVQLDYRPVGALNGILSYLTSKYVFYSYGDFRIKPSKNQVVVNLWHGTPLKKIGKLTGDMFLKNENLDNFTSVLAASDLFVPVMAEAFGCPVDKVKVLGHTRNDYLFYDNHVLEKIVPDYQKFSKCVLWMPTFRQSKDNRFVDSASFNSETLLPILDDYEKLIQFDKKLQDLNILLVIKVHPYAKFKDVQLKNIVMLKNEDILPKGIKLYEFVKDFDALLTDYSSIYFDFMLLDRPIGFTLDDYQSYSDNRGFVFDNAIDFMPGNHIYDMKDMINFIVSVKNGNDEFKNERNALLLKVCKYLDGKNCKRLADEIGISL